MSLYLITGVAGSGKSEVQRALKSRGYEAYDTDGDGFAKWHNDQTGYVHPKSSVKAEDRTEEFIRTHSWKVPRPEVEVLAEQARNKTIFLCGATANENEIRDLFSEMFALHVDEDTLKHRLLTREHNNWGKQPHELEQTLQAHREAVDIYKQQGHIVIEATRPIDEVVMSILKHTGPNK